MPTQTRFLCPSGGANVDLSGIFEDLGGGTSYGTATKFKIGSVDLTGYFHASSGEEDRPNFNTGFKVKVGGTSTDLSAIFRRRGFVGITITTQPTNQIVVNNTSATFSIAATAPGTPSYQWYKNGSIISGATSTTYTTGALTTANDTDTYFCRVSYSGSSVDSNSVSTKIKPYITDQPDGGSFNEGDGIQLNITAAGSGTLSYQWYKNGNIISGATSSQYPLGGQFSLNSSTAASYTCKVTSTHDATGVTSNAAVISIIPPIVTISAGQFIFNNGNVVAFSSSLSQGTNVTYQWYGPSGLISGATGSSYSFNISSSTYGAYYVRATNNGGYDDSNIITVYMNPLITVNPSNQTVTAGSTASFSITAVGSPILSYQWYKNGGLISGATNSSYTTPTLTSSDNANTYYCIVSCSVSGTSTATSGTATLTVNYAPTIGVTKFDGTTLSYNLQSFSISNGSQFTIEIANVDDGNPNGSGSWYKWNGSTYVSLGVGSYSYALNQDDDSTDYYRYQLSNAYGTAYSYEIEVVTG